MIDIQRNKALIEIQTRNFAAIRRKLFILTQRYPVRLLHPIPQEKYIIRLANNPAAKVLRRRKSPKRGLASDLFLELVSFPDLIKHPNFSIEVLLTHEEEIQQRGRGGSWRRKGWKIVDRKLVKVVENLLFETPTDFLQFLPRTLPDPFTSRELAEYGRYPLYLAQKITYCLRQMGAINVVGKHRTAMLYSRCPTSSTPPHR